MGDQFGALALPPTAAVTGEAAGDPCLSRIANYLKAWLNVECLTAFRSVFPTAASAAVVNHAFIHDPAQCVFNERDCPSLYLFRTGGEAAERVSEDYDITHDVVQLYWVFPPVAPETQRIRSPMASAVQKEVVHAIEIGRHPAYVLAGDPDATASSQGSVIYRVAGIYAIDVGAWDVSKIQVQMQDGKPKTYDRLGIKILLQEQRTLDIVTDFSAASGLDLTIKNSDGTRTTAVGST